MLLCLKSCYHALCDVHYCVAMTCSVVMFKSCYHALCDVHYCVVMTCSVVMFKVVLSCIV